MTSYVLDHTGTSAGNKILDEAIDIASSKISIYGYFQLDAGLFYKNGLSVSHTNLDGVTRVLVADTDYWPCFKLVGASIATPANTVWGGLVLGNPNLKGTLSVSYQAFGGGFILNKIAIDNYLSRNEYSPILAFIELVCASPLPVVDNAAVFTLDSFSEIERALATFGTIVLSVAIKLLASRVPAAPTGTAGAKGDKGDTGDAGLNGVDGESAYVLAVNGGFVGTQPEWLASLNPATDLINLTDRTKGSAKIGHAHLDTGSVGTTVQAILNSIPGGLGDYSVDRHLMLFCGDSTTEQDGASGYGFDQMTLLRAPGEKLESILGTINFGGSGHQIASWVDGAVGALPTYSTSNLGVSNNDYYGHKTTGATSLATQLAWRAGKANLVTWSICYGINDCVLNASVGNLSQLALSDYIESYLHAAITRIKAAYPQDRIVLQTPNPMTARPYASAAGFPSPAAYPNFGADATTDQALVEKWNQGIYRAYLSAKNKHSGTVLFDTWVTVFGVSNTTLLATTQLPFLGDLVHPSGNGYVARAKARVGLLCGTFTGSAQRRAEAEARATALSIKPWEVYPGYFRENPRYKFMAEGTLIGVGASYADIAIPFTDWMQQITGSYYVVIGERVAQYFETSNPVVLGVNTRILGVVPTAAMRAAASGQSVQIYTDNIQKFVANDSYVNGLAIVAKEYIDFRNIIGAGAGYIDIAIPVTLNRVSTKFLSGMRGGTLVVGGTVNSTLSLTGSNIVRSGSTGQRSIRILIGGAYASYGGQPAAIIFGDDKPSPRAFEYIPKAAAFIPHSVGNKGFIFAELSMVDGATFGVSMVNQVGSIVTVDVYSLAFPNRTLIGTISVPANNNGGILANGNPTSVEAGYGYEFVITSATSGSAPLICTMTPN